jgi:hypothetical protein
VPTYRSGQAPTSRSDPIAARNVETLSVNGRGNDIRPTHTRETSNRWRAAATGLEILVAFPPKRDSLATSVHSHLLAIESMPAELVP